MPFARNVRDQRPTADTAGRCSGGLDVVTSPERILPGTGGSPQAAHERFVG